MEMDRGRDGTEDKGETPPSSPPPASTPTPQEKPAESAAPADDPMRTAFFSSSVPARPEEPNITEPYRTVHERMKTTEPTPSPAAAALQGEIRAFLDELYRRERELVIPLMALTISGALPDPRGTSSEFAVDTTRFVGQVGDTSRAVEGLRELFESLKDIQERASELSGRTGYGLLDSPFVNVPGSLLSLWAGIKILAPVTAMVADVVPSALLWGAPHFVVHAILTIAAAGCGAYGFGLLKVGASQLVCSRYPAPHTEVELEAKQLEESMRSAREAFLAVSQDLAYSMAAIEKQSWALHRCAADALWKNGGTEELHAAQELVMRADNVHKLDAAVALEIRREASQLANARISAEITDRIWDGFRTAKSVLVYLTEKCESLIGAVADPLKPKEPAHDEASPDAEQPPTEKETIVTLSVGVDALAEKITELAAQPATRRRLHAAVDVLDDVLEDLATLGGLNERSRKAVLTKLGGAYDILEEAAQTSVESDRPAIVDIAARLDEVAASFDRSRTDPISLGERIRLVGYHGLHTFTGAARSIRRFGSVLVDSSQDPPQMILEIVESILGMVPTNDDDGQSAKMVKNLFRVLNAYPRWTAGETGAALGEAAINYITAFLIKTTPYMQLAVKEMGGGTLTPEMAREMLASFDGPMGKYQHGGVKVAKRAGRATAALLTLPLRTAKWLGGKLEDSVCPVDFRPIASYDKWILTRGIREKDASLHRLEETHQFLRRYRGSGSDQVVRGVIEEFISYEENGRPQDKVREIGQHIRYWEELRARESLHSRLRAHQHRHELLRIDSRLGAIADSVDSDGWRSKFARLKADIAKRPLPTEARNTVLHAERNGTLIVIDSEGDLRRIRPGRARAFVAGCQVEQFSDSPAPPLLTLEHADRARTAMASLVLRADPDPYQNRALLACHERCCQSGEEQDFVEAARSLQRVDFSHGQLFGAKLPGTNQPDPRFPGLLRASVIGRGRLDETLLRSVEDEVLYGSPEA